ncbi:MAG: ATPase [Desulfurococcaceae archaeon]|uniref:ATPase n=1 Tax=Staphylothermus marinus TaxID=2280 RepID=A0A7C4H8B5_STAMA
MDQLAVGLSYLGGTLALLGGLLGSSLGLGKTGIAGSAALAEDPKQFRNVFLLAALPMTQTFYGLIVMIQFTLFLNTVVSQGSDFQLNTGLAMLGLGLAASFAEAFSAWYQGLVCASGIAELPRTKGKITFNTMILAIYVELIGILGMVFSIMGLSIIRAAIGV